MLFIPGAPSKGCIKLDREIIYFNINNTELCGPAAWIIEVPMVIL